MIWVRYPEKKLLWTIKTHEIVKKQNKDSRKKTIALKGPRDHLSRNESDEELDDHEIATVVRNFKKFMKFNKKWKEKEELGGSSRSKREKKDVITCFKYYKPSHV